MPTFTCPSCGFIAFDEHVGSYEICEICDWEDDPVQLMYPALAGGANKVSLYESQLKILRAVPLQVTIHMGYRRDPTWRPLRADEAVPPPEQPKTGREYFDAIPYDRPKYYWL
jgi:cysteine-rich CPCC protein